jgi:Pyruvate/2-oxoacid:ferredoxin oxidoreductase delta subunit
VKACKPPAGNGSLRLEIRYDRCLGCNECGILVTCPSTAIVRVLTPGLSPTAAPGGEPHA